MADEQVKELSIEEMRGMLTDEAPAAQPEKPAEAAQPASPEPVQPEAAAAGVTDESASGAGTQETQEPKEEDKKFAPKEDVPKGVQKRIDKAVYEKHEAERQADAAKREAEELRKQLEQFQAPGKPAPAPTEAAKPAPFQYAEAEPRKPKVSQDDYETIDEYLDARDAALSQYNDEHALWVIRKDQAETAARQQREARDREYAETQAKLAQTWTANVQKTAEKRPELIQVLNGPVGKWIGETAQLGDVADMIRRSPVGPEIVLYMSDHPDETMEVAKTGNAMEVAAYAGKIQAEILSPKAPKPTPDRLSELPPPPSVAGGQASPMRGIDLNDPKTSMEDWGNELRRQLEAVS